MTVVPDQESDLFLEGTNITFTCPPGLLLSGPNALMCMGNGKWGPDLDAKRVMCKGAMLLTHQKVILLHNI